MDSRIEELIDYCFSLGQGGWNNTEDKTYYMTQALAKAKELKLNPLPGPAFAASSPEYEPDYAFTREEQIGKFAVDATDLEELPMGEWKKVLEAYEHFGRVKALQVAYGLKEWTYKETVRAVDRIIYRGKV